MSAASFVPLAHEVVDEIIARHGERTGDVLGILEEAQRRHPQNYLPPATYAYVAQRLGVPRSQMMSVVTFYAFFNRQPQGRHTLTVCRGTACHTRGSRQLLATVKVQSGAPADEASASYTTPDGRLTIRTVACFGQCALAPVAAIDAAIHSHVDAYVLRRLLDELTVADAGGGDECGVATVSCAIAGAPR